MILFSKTIISKFNVHSFWNRIFKSVSLTKLIVVMFRFVSFVQVHVIVRKKVIMILRADHISFILIFLLNVFIRIKKWSLILSKLVIIIFIIKVFVCLGSPVSCIYHILHNSFEACWCFFCSILLLNRQIICINLKLLNLLINIIHCFLNIALFSISRKVQRLKGR